MRTIKFRGKNRQGKWLCGDLLHRDNESYILPEDALDSMNNYLVIPDTVGQYTGLIDKNGMEIYEGDVLANVNQPNKCVVEWNRHLAQFQGTWTNMPITAADIYSMVLLDYRVFGNVHDNPELSNSL